MSRKVAAEVLSLVWTALLILFLRWAVVEPFKIPSGSMIPTLLVGDFIFVAKSSFDLRIPFTDIPVIRIDDPKRGDVIVFAYPNNEKDPAKDGEYYIKRLIGLPGDRVAVKRGYPVVNGDLPKIEAITDDQAISTIQGFRYNSNNLMFWERLPGTDRYHWVQRYPYRGGGDFTDDGTDPPCGPIGPHQFDRDAVGYIAPAQINEICEFEVPANHYFFMGDNRDDSADGRTWGLVHRNLLKGRALFTWFTCDSLETGRATSDIGHCLTSIRWSRLGKGIR